MRLNEEMDPKCSTPTSNIRRSFESYEVGEENNIDYLEQVMQMFCNKYKKHLLLQLFSLLLKMGQEWSQLPWDLKLEPRLAPILDQITT